MDAVQLYETTLYDRETQRGFSFVVLPRRSIWEKLQESAAPAYVDDFEDVYDRRAMDLLDAPGRVPTWALPFAIEACLSRNRRSRFRFFEEDDTPFGRGPSAFAQDLAYNPVVPFESSPLGGKSLGEIAGGGAAALGAYATGEPLLLLTVPGGIILGGAAQGISEALRIGLRARLLDLMGVVDPDDPNRQRP